MRRLRDAIFLCGLITLVSSLPLPIVVASVGAQATREENPQIPIDLNDRTLRVPQNATSLEANRTGPVIAQAGAVDPATYVLGPGDVLELDLWGRLSRLDVLEVSPEGRIFLSGSGPIAVSGHTLAWAEQRVLNTVAEIFRGVHAELKLIRLRTFKVYLSGLVTRPGAIEVNSATRASEAIARVGLAEGGSRREIAIHHRDGTTGRLDLQLFETTGRQDLDPPLLDGDVLQVPRMTQFMDAAGAVASPGRFEVGSNDSLTTLISMAGGLLPSAERDRALLVRFRSASQRESVWLSHEELEARGSALPLRDGDRLFVYFTPDFHRQPSVEIYGEIARPGSYPIVLGRDRLGDLLRWAGGFSPRANRSAIRLLRSADDGKEADPEFDRLARLSRQEMTESEYAVFQTKLAEKKNSFRVDYDRLQKNSRDIDPLLQSGDLVRVDELVPSVRVEGEVRRPGYVEFGPGRSFGDYVELAGGYTGRAARGKVQVSRSVTGQVLPARSAQTIGPGDFIWVPERRDIDAWQIFRDVVAVGGQIAVIVLAAKK